jgi:adenine-specific DNA-methyltransferase
MMTSMKIEIEKLREEANKKLNTKNKSALGQFMTPYNIAQFMASLFKNKKDAILMDAGSGIGSLTMACTEVLEIKKIEAWEIDETMLSYLNDNLAKTNIEYIIHPKDFIIDSVHRIKNNEKSNFTHAILNPPYKKINTNSVHRKACSDVGIESVNLYTSFFALAILQMANKGEIVIIIPRSFCNGTYYKPFRKFLLENCSIDFIHSFESRKQAFKDDEVLQENVVMKVTKNRKQGKVTISHSKDSTFQDLSSKEYSFTDIVKPEDKEQYIHIPTDKVEFRSELYECTISELGLNVSTGPVVDFRVKEQWAMQPEENTAPMLYSHHFIGHTLSFPKTTKKPNSLKIDAKTERMLMPSGNYVLVRRFSSKEEKRRVVAYIVNRSILDYDQYAFENHWNVFHIKKTGIDETLAKGLACFLNSSELDEHFRVFSGHTQVNATDLKNMKYPSYEKLMSLGRRYHQTMTQDEIDSLIEEI